MTSRRLAYASVVVAAIGAAVYFFIYLYRWEWNRALIAGVIFIAAEVAIAAAAILNRLKRLEERHPPCVDHEQQERVREAPFAPSSSFSWLNREDELRVFIPVLLGAGVLVSALAWVVERLAWLTARPVVEERVVAQLAPISWPEGGLRSTGGPPQPARAAMRRTVFRQAAVAVAVVVLGAMAVDGLADLTQNRPDNNQPGIASAVTIEVSTRDLAGDAESATRKLWAACSSTVQSHDLRSVGMSAEEEGRAHLLIEPPLGRYGERRLSGCLQDATLDRTNARVLSVERLD